ncbi:hypothetical protein [Agromyces sp. NPDC058064]|uniref:hypothetical protein n=1 Tax=Agromyces sp. NPDC058064 TaxID=3346322 RepID=UPI0036D97463
MPEWLVSIILGVFTLMGAVVATIGGVMIAKINTAKKHAESAAASSATAAEQTANSHKTNLRDDIDKLTSIAQAAVDTAQASVDAVKTVQKDIGGLREENRLDRKAADERISSVERALLNHLTNTKE